MASLSYALLWLIGVLSAPPRRDEPPLAVSYGKACYLFEGELLIDHDAGHLPHSANDLPEWSDMRRWLMGRFANLPARLDDLADGAPVIALSRTADDTAQLEICRSGETCRVVLTDPPHTYPAERHAVLTEHARLTELREALETAPYPAWKTTLDGAILWQNTACTETFEPRTVRTNVPLPDSGHCSTTRFSIPVGPRAEPRWFEVSSTAHENHVMHHATDVTQVVHAETTQRDFVQTLTKTFAYLTIGLAVFDKNRQLALFNPALVDLTSLPVDFLSARPELMSFFDNLRNRQVMPEPRSYASWRAQITEMIESARDGHYQETWMLPNDVTYRVTGRPHPDGAVAFLFEDITSEVMVARRYRVQLDLRQSALDSLPEAVMIIGPNGVLSFCNAACSRLLQIDPDSCFSDMTVSDLIAACSAALPDTRLWPEIERALRQRTLDAPLRKTAPIHGLGTLSYRVEPLPAGARMLTLDLAVATRTVPARLAAG
nr:PAS-domain containing protein [uncultured Roseovarius sp.]